jgi:hypothetical protein
MEPVVEDPQKDRVDRAQGQITNAERLRHMIYQPAADMVDSTTYTKRKPTAVQYKVTERDFTAHPDVIREKNAVNARDLPFDTEEYWTDDYFRLTRKEVDELSEPLSNVSTIPEQCPAHIAYIG